jgi:zinc transport system permease protein
MTEFFSLFGTALIAILLASFASGTIGSYVVVKRLSFLSGSIAHSILGGVGFALWLRDIKGFTFIDPIYGAFLAAILSALLIGSIYIHFSQRSDALIGAIWSFGMAIGVIFFSFIPAYSTELTHFLFGNILWVNHNDLIRLMVLDIALLSAIGFFYIPLLTHCLDEEQAYLQGYSRSYFTLFLLILISLSVVILMQVIGIILVLALLTLPVMIAGTFTTRLFPLMLFSVLGSALLGIAGLLIAILLNIPAGATIAILCGLSYLAVLVVRKIFLTTKKAA